MQSSQLALAPQKRRRTGTPPGRAPSDGFRPQRRSSRRTTPSSTSSVLARLRLRSGAFFFRGAAAPALGAALAEGTHRDKHSNTMYIGTAAWSIPRDVAHRFPGDGSHLERYARRFACVEINTSFYRSHQAETYARWAGMTPPPFRFAVKLPRTITHDAALRGTRTLLRAFLAETAGLGDRLGVLLVQLPPSLAWDARVARTFFGLLRESWDGPVACEPRHPGWLAPAADRALARLRVSRVAADPARGEAAARPGGWLGPAGDGVGALLYYRWHGSPRVYWSSYDEPWLAQQAARLAEWPPGAVPWVIFDNTASGAATANALALQSLVTAPDVALTAP